MEMSDQFHKELLSFDEKIQLSKLEAVKAEQRTQELEYQKARFTLDFYLASMKRMEEKRAKEQKNKDK